MRVGILSRIRFAFTIAFHYIYPPLNILLTIYTLIYIPQLANTIKANQWLFLAPLLMVLSVANITRQITRHK